MNKIKETILFTAEVAATGATLYLAWRVIAGPNATKILNMRLAKGAENFCQHQAEGWAFLSDQCKKAYDVARSVTL